MVKLSKRSLFSISGQYKHSAEFNTFSRSASKVVADAWEHCINAYGTKAYALIEGPTIFILAIRRTVDSGSPQFQMDEITMAGSPINCDPPLSTAAGHTYDDGLAQFTCTRSDPTKDVVITPKVKGLNNLLIVSLPGNKPIQEMDRKIYNTNALECPSSGVCTHKSLCRQVPDGWTFDLSTAVVVIEESQGASKAGLDPGTGPQTLCWYVEGPEGSVMKAHASIYMFRPKVAQ